MQIVSENVQKLVFFQVLFCASDCLCFFVLLFSFAGSQFILLTTGDKIIDYTVWEDRKGILNFLTRTG